MEDVVPIEDKLIRWNNAVRSFVNSENPENARSDTLERALSDGLVTENEATEFEDWLIQNGARESIRRKHPPQQPQAKEAWQMTREEKIETEPTPATPAVKGKIDKAYLNDNTAIDFQYEVVNHDDLVSSHDDQLRKNPNYPQERQPRERDSQRYMGQITEIANKINPERLGKSASISDGSPVIDKMSNVVESGNGRTIAIGKAYKEGKAESYKQWLIDNADEFGLNPDDIKKMDKPVLVRRRMNDMSPEQIKDYTAKANQSAVAKLTPSEQAKIDADNLTADALALFTPNEEDNLNTFTNRAFINKFVEIIGTADSTGYFTDKHEPNKDLLDRVKNAVIQKAYGSDYLVKEIAEEANPDMRNILNSLNVAAGDFAKARGLNSNFNGIDIVDKLIDAFKFIKQARSDYAGDVAGGIKNQVNQALKQGSMFETGIDSITKEIVEVVIDNFKSGKRVGEFFKYMAKGLREYISEINQQAIFGDKEQLTTKALVERAKKLLGGTNEDLFGTGQDTKTDTTGQGKEKYNQPDKQGHTGKGVEQGKPEGDTKRAEAEEETEDIILVGGEIEYPKNPLPLKKPFVNTGDLYQDLNNAIYGDEGSAYINKLYKLNDYVFALIPNKKVKGQSYFRLYTFNKGKYQAKVKVIYYGNKISDRGTIGQMKVVEAEAEAAEKGEVGDKGAEGKTNKIDDFGEKIKGAKKDTWQSKIDSLDIDDITDSKNLTVDNLISKPDYQELIDNGLSKKSAAFIFLAREELKSTIRKYGKRYILVDLKNKVKPIITAIKSIVNGNDIANIIEKSSFKKETDFLISSCYAVI